MDAIRQELIFSGRVQGVGFRFRVHQIAQSHPITGWVKNLSDGTVQIVVEGNLDDIEAFVEEVVRTINASRYGSVESYSRSGDSMASGEIGSFSVR